MHTKTGHETRSSVKNWDLTIFSKTPTSEGWGPLQGVWSWYLVVTAKELPNELTSTRMHFFTCPKRNHFRDTNVSEKNLILLTSRVLGFKGYSLSERSESDSRFSAPALSNNSCVSSSTPSISTSCPSDMLHVTFFDSIEAAKPNFSPRDLQIV